MAITVHQKQVYSITVAMVTLYCYHRDYQTPCHATIRLAEPHYLVTYVITAGN